MQIALKILPYLIGLNLAAVLVVLFKGLGTMTQGKSRDGNIMMRWRIGLQASCVVLFLLYVGLMRLS